MFHLHTSSMSLFAFLRVTTTCFCARRINTMWSAQRERSHDIRIFHPCLVRPDSCGGRGTEARNCPSELPCNQKLVEAARMKPLRMLASNGINRSGSPCVWPRSLRLVHIGPHGDFTAGEHLNVCACCTTAKHKSWRIQRLQ